MGFPGGSDGKESACNARDLGSIPGLGRSPGGGHGNPLQYYCLENPHGQRSLVGYSTGLQRAGHDWVVKHTHVHIPSPSFFHRVNYLCCQFKCIYISFLFYFIFKLYIIVLVLPNIKMNPPQVYMCSPSWTLLPSSLPIPSLWVVPVHQPQASSIVYRTWTGNSFHTWYFTCFNAILPNLPTLSLSHRVHKTVLYISISFAVSYTGLLLPSS